MSKSRIAVLSLLTLGALTSCVGMIRHPAEPVVEATGLSEPPLRIAHDRARGRRWELGWEALVAYHAATNRPIRRVALEGAGLTPARGTCRPDMLLDRWGALLVSSNTQPVIWRVSPERFEVERFELRLHGARGRDIGWSGLAWAAGGRLLHARDAATGMPWQVDLASLEARPLPAGTEVAPAC